MALPKPEGLQREVLALPSKGHYVVLGSAGSGKTTLAILRAKYLADVECEEGERVLIVTFNKSLVTYLKHMGLHPTDNIEIQNFHRVARGYLSSRNCLSYGDIVPTGEYKRNNKLKIIQEAINELQEEISSVNRETEFFYEEIAWIQKMGIRSYEEYRSTERIGMTSSRVSRIQRDIIFKLYLKYMEIRGQKGFKYDWDDIAYYMDKELEEDHSKRRYKHIIIDEGQDFSPVMLRSLVKLVSKEGSLTFFGDVAQQIYGSRISWRSAGINMKKIWRFDQNYRNTKEIAELALAISQQKYFKKDPDLVLPKFPRALGPKPAIIKFSAIEEELKWILKYAVKNSKNSTIAILERNREKVNLVENKLKELKVKYQILSGDMNKWNELPGITIGTYHSAKGLEFDMVIIPFCNTENIPDKSKILACEDREEALSEDIKLIYVSVTRAKRGVMITYTNNKSELIPDNINNIYQEFNF
ncbi:3'-5' exonuclease [Romboutsia sp.]|uniref:3'-5' exonuclease n=1 Tax=Romboutsia sp. TaxID=1965302 RepID=UPI002C82F4FB|nr:3'-5' exonuclease [Romboutsia sp.]HSQ88387.1 3'-5' exonuclease [Romboutsia sp.]